MAGCQYCQHALCSSLRSIVQCCAGLSTVHAGNTDILPSFTPVQGSDSDGRRELGLGSYEAVGYAGRMQCFRMWGWGGGCYERGCVLRGGGGWDGRRLALPTCTGAQACMQLVGVSEECLGRPPCPNCDVCLPALWVSHQHPPQCLLVSR